MLLSLVRWLKKIKNFANNLKTSIENESRMNDLKKILVGTKGDVAISAEQMVM